VSGDGYYVQRPIQVWSREGERFEVGPDADTGDFVEVRYYDEQGKCTQSVSFPHEVWAHLQTYDPRLHPERERDQT